MYKNIEILDDLPDDTKIYRYMCLSQFLSIVETKHIYFRKITTWQDKWEAPFISVKYCSDNPKKQDSEYNMDVSLDKAREYVFAMCWSLNHESDSMWRIYSRDKEGIAIGTTVAEIKRINCSDCFERIILAKVNYYDKPEDAVEIFKKFPSIHCNALLKRNTFKHEDEVRIIAIKNREDISEDHEIHIYVPVEPTNFITSVIIDPSAEEWYVEAIKKYCKRLNFNFEPFRSTIYDPPPKFTLRVTKEGISMDENHS